MRFKPTTFFVLGLLIGLGYVGASFFAQYMLLQRAGLRVTSKVREIDTLKEKHKKDKPKIEELQKTVTSSIKMLKLQETLYEKHYSRFQAIITQIVKLGKRHDLTFLDYRLNASHPTDALPGGRIFSSELSLGGSFENIMSFMSKLKEKTVPLPIIVVEILASKQKNTRLKLTFRYLGEITRFLKKLESSNHTLSSSGGVLPI